MRELFYPRNETLKKYIKYISFYRSDDDARAFLVFPNPGSGVGLHKQHGFVSHEKNIYQSVGTPGNDSELLHINRIDPVKVIDNGIREVITIVFQPLGVNKFIQGNLSDYVKNHNNDPSFIAGVPSLKEFAKMVFAKNSIEEQGVVIEKFLLNIFREVHIPFVADAVTLLSDVEQNHSIPSICKQIGTSPRNLVRLFNKHICLSPVEFKNISQFRYSLYKKVEAGKSVQLKDIGYESNYTHSSYMVRMYKKYTGLNPSSFFDKVSVESNYVFMSL